MRDLVRDFDWKYKMRYVWGDFDWDNQMGDF